MLTEQEMDTIREKLGRDPTAAEEATLDALWSEHCSYKSSKRWFHLFNTESERVKLGIGEGAGLIDIGDGYLIGIGLESHNHPSAVDPFNGAATGVGGIIRDIVSQGCKPIAILDCLRFGIPTSSRQKLLLDQVVLGISSYGNCVGIPNLGGDTEFATEFTTNPLVNAMCVGVVHQDKVIRSIASNPGDRLLLFGSSSGRDGIGGVTFASEDLDDKQQENRGSVQIGDPLTEKILIDAIIELRDKDLLNGLQDLGGGGLVCAAAEMAEKGGTAVHLTLDEVPIKADDMKGWEILVSESQERMLAVVDPSKIEKITEILDFYDLRWAVVGEIKEGNTFTAEHQSKIEAELPVDFTINGFPEPDREVGTPVDTVSTMIDTDKHILEFLLSNYNTASRRSIYQQYDQHVQGNTVYDATRDAGVCLLPNGKHLSVAAGTNSYLVSMDPELGASLATLAVMRKTIARGGLPIGMVDSLNAGNPEKASSYGEFVSMIRGVAKVSHEMAVPVVGGNVSLYNESDQGGNNHKILASPFVGITSIIENEPISPYIAGGSTKIFRVGNQKSYLKGSEYGRYFGFDDEMETDFKTEMDLVLFFTSHGNMIESATPIGRGGMLTTLAKWAIHSRRGVKVDMELGVKDLYGENGANYLIEINPDNLDKLKSECPSLKFVPVASPIENPEFVFDQNWDLKMLEHLWEQPLAKAMTS